MKLTIPTPQRAAFSESIECAACSCEWTIDKYGEPNVVSDACETSRCPCHDSRFSASIYESGVAA